MNVMSVLLWGWLATAVLTTLMSAGQGLGLSRMSIPFMIGTLFSAGRARAMVLGAVVHWLMGWAFAFFYAALFESLGYANVWLGAGLGLLHGLVVLTTVMPILPNFHPRMATERQGPNPPAPSNHRASLPLTMVARPLPSPLWRMWCMAPYSVRFISWRGSLLLLHRGHSKHFLVEQAVYDKKQR